MSLQPRVDLTEERKWFSDRLRIVADELRSNLQIGINACSGGVDGVLVNNSPGSAATLVVSSSNSGAVKGFVTMNGAAVVKGDLTIKLAHYNRASPFKISINQSKPCVLSQMSLANNCLVTCMDLLACATEVYDTDLDMRHFQDAISNIVRYLVKAREYLETPSESQLFPQKEPDPKCFQPELQDDLIIEFSTKRTLLNVSIYALSLHQQGIPLHLQNKLLGKFKHFKIGSYKGKEIEIVDEVSIDIVSPKLAEAFNSIEHTEALCRDTLAKLTMHNSVF
ncbi:hypothetical protein QVD99_008296 [Batrachochytrium dendrobatidis]|nr:hypothetical protein QVD99_008296 [Batrachochytrium dendrobatidis]